MELKDLLEMIKKSSLDLKEASDAHALEVKTLGEASAETKAQLDEAVRSQTEMKSLVDNMEQKLEVIELESKRIRDSAPKGEKKSVGSVFTESEIYRGMKSSQRGNGAPVTVERKDITSLSASAGSLVRADRDPTVYQNPKRPISIRDLMPSIPTTSGNVEYMRQLVFTNNAGPQGTASGQGAGELVAKNESNITWELVNETVKTIAHWVPASRQVLADAPMLTALIDLDLPYGLSLEGDNQLLLGDGSGQNMTGLLVDAAVPTVGQIAAGTAAADVPASMIDHIRSAMTKTQEAEYYNTTGVILNPTDWARIETAKSNDGHYLMIQFPSSGADDMIWKVPVIVTNAMPANNFILGDFTMGAKVYDRESVEIRVSESHGEMFVKNGVVVLAEERYVLGIQRPLAFCKGLFTVA